MTGGGNDIIKFAADQLNGPESGGHKTVFYDLATQDKIQVAGNVAPADVALSEATTSGVKNTTVKIKNKDEFLLKAIAKADVKVAALAGGGVEITTTKSGNVKPEELPIKPPGQGR